MENINEKQKKDKKGLERSVAYPSIPLERAIDLIVKLRAALGKTPYSREEAAKALDYSGISGASARTIAALTHYGLLDRNGNTYSVSNLAEEIIHPTDETGEARKQAIVKAARNPKLFDKLINKFQGQSLPTLLENILMREGINSNSAKEAAITFKDTLQYSGILVNGVVSIESMIEPIDSSAPVKNSSGGFDFATDFFGSQGKTKNILQVHIHNESGTGWSLNIKTDVPLNSEIKRKLIDVTELLNQINNQQK